MVALLNPGDFLVHEEESGKLKVMLCSTGRFAMDKNSRVEFDILSNMADLTKYWHPSVSVVANDLGMKVTRPARTSMRPLHMHAACIIAAELVGAAVKAEVSTDGMRSTLTISSEGTGHEGFVETLRQNLLESAPEEPNAGAAAPAAAAAPPTISSVFDQETVESGPAYYASSVNGGLRDDDAASTLGASWKLTRS